MTRNTTLIPSVSRAEAARTRIVSAARELVAERGYEGVSTGEVLRRAGVSRGGLYHHFAGKDELMTAVLVAVERDITERLADAVADAPDPMSALRDGTQWFLDECLRSNELRRIGLHEGRKALGWEAWREAMAPYGLTMLEATLRAGAATGQLAPVDAQAMAHVLLAMLHEAATMIFTAPDPEAERERLGPVVAAVVDGLRAP